MNGTNNIILKMVLVSILGKKVVEHVILPFFRDFTRKRVVLQS